jgi:hypothetical protein
MMVDMSPTSVGRFIATAVATGWLITSSVTPDKPEAPDPRASGARPTRSETQIPTHFTEKLRERLNESARPERGRNPFVYGARRATPRYDDAPPAAEPPRAPTAAVPVEPPLPVFRLSGIAASQQDGVTVLTAIVIDNGAMVFAKAGDKLSNGYSVVRVEESSVTLVDANGVTQTLRLP